MQKQTTQARADYVLGAKQNIKQEEKDEDIEKEKQTLAEKFLNTVPQSLQNRLDRPDLIQQLKAGFQAQAEKGVEPMQIICGMGGVGKTQLAISYVDAHRQDKNFVYWIYADEAQLENQWLAFGEKLLRKKLEDIPKSEQLQLIQEKLSEQKNWLIVLDDLRSIEKLKRILLPRRFSPTQQVLITTRSQHWNDYPALDIPPFTPKESQDYLEARLRPDQCVDADKLAQELGYLPLALAHAAAYIRQSDITAKTYLERYKENGIILLNRLDMKSEAEHSGYQWRILVTYFLSIHALIEKKGNATAVELLKYCAYLHPEGIQRELLQKLLDINDLDMDQCIRDIQDYSLLAKGSTSFSMHRLIQATIQYYEKPSLEEQKDKPFPQRLRPITKVLCALYPYEKQSADYDKARGLMPHLKTVAKHLELYATKERGDENSAEACLASLLNAMGDFHWSILGDAHQALLSYEKALELYLKVYEEEEAHPSVAASYNGLGLCCYELSKLKSAKNNHKKALKIRKIYERKNFDRDSADDVATSCDNLGNTYYGLGEFNTALSYQQRGLAIRLEIHGHEHPKVAASHNDLGLIYVELGNAEEALICHQKALKIRLKYYEEGHPLVATSYNNLGMAYEALGDTEKALDNYHIGLTKRLNFYPGISHPHIAKSYRNLGNLYKKLDNILCARINLEKALCIYQRLKRQKDISDVQRELAALYSVKPAGYPGTIRNFQILSPVAALRAYPGILLRTLLDQEQQAKVCTAAEAEEKMDSNTDKKTM